MSTVTVTATVESDHVPQRVRLNVASSDATSATVTRLNPDGTTTPVRTNDGGPLVITSGVGLLYDYEAPFGVPTSYSTVETPGSSSAQVTVNSTSVWLVHPGVPELSMPIELRAGSLAEESYAVQRGVFWPMGRETPVIVTDGSRKGMQSSMTVSTETGDEVRAIRDLLRDAGPLYLNIPPSLGYLIDSCYIAVGDVRISRLTSIGSMPQRDVEMPFTVVDRPVGGSQAERTLLDLLDYPSLNALSAAYPTLYDLMAGP